MEKRSLFAMYSFPKIRTWDMLCPAQPHYSPKISEISTSHSSQFRNPQQDWDRSAADIKKMRFHWSCARLQELQIWSRPSINSTSEQGCSGIPYPCPVMECRRAGAGGVHLSACAGGGKPLKLFKITTVFNANNVGYYSVTWTANNC